MAATQAASEYFRLGQDLCKRGLFTDAIAAFTEALNATHDASTQATILDARALAKTKAFPDDLKEALKDARRMMKLRDKDAKGYLRAGKVLQLMAMMEKTEGDQQKTMGKAVQIYELGLKAASDEGGKGKKLLEDMLKKCQMRLKKEVRMDPFASLPNEIVHMIIEYLPFSAVMRMQRVSKGWHNFLRASERRIKHLDFSQGKRAVKKTTLKHYLHHQRMQKSVTSITIRKAAFDDTDSLVLMFRAAPLLEELRLGPIRFPTDAIVKAAAFGKALKVLELGNLITYYQVEQIMRILPKLETMVCHKVEPPITMPVTLGGETREGLRIMALSFQSWVETAVGYADFHKFLLQYPKLEKLDLTQPPIDPADRQDLTGLEHLEAYSCAGIRGLNFPKLPESIRRLDISRCPYLICPGPSLSPDPADINISLLEELSLTNCNSRDARIDNILAQLDSLVYPRKLRSLQLSGMPVETNELIEALIERGFAESLVELSLRDNPSFGDAQLQKMTTFVNLECLDIGITKVTGVGLVKVMRHFDNALAGRIPWKWVGLDQCNKISRDTVEMMRKRGILVDHNVDF